MALSVWGDTLRIELSLSMSSASSACGPCAGLIRPSESALRLLETVLPHDHPDLVKVLADLPAAYRALGRRGDAEKVLRGQRAIAGSSIPPFTLVLALIFALALSALSSPRLDALPPALCAPT